jgi:DNA repair protein RecO (recombination protein O)
MPRPATRLAQQRLDSTALLVSRHPVGEADLVVRLFTESSGMLGVVARNARRSAKRFGALEPMHVLKVRIDTSPLRDLGTLAEASLERPRIGITAQLATMEAAGRALRWLRRAAPTRSSEPELWHEVNRLLDGLDAVPPEHAARVGSMLAASGLRMLAATGWALELTRCVRCEKACPERSRSILDVAAGGIVCRACGGRGEVLTADERHAFVRATEGDDDALVEGASRAIDVVERALEVHGRGEAT